MEQAIAFELERQADVLEYGGQVVQETRLYDHDRGQTRGMRTKEEAHDYRYFPDPDLLPVVVDAALIEAARAALPELPQAKRERFMSDYGLADDTAQALTASRALADYFEEVVEALAQQAKAGDSAAQTHGQNVANWVMGALAGALNRDALEIADTGVSAELRASLLARIADGTISGKIAKEVFEALWAGEAASADAVIAARGLQPNTDSGAIEALVEQVIADNPAQVQQYRDGKTKVLGYLVGQVMKASQGKANPAEANKMLAAKLAE